MNKSFIVFRRPKTRRAKLVKPKRRRRPHHRNRRRPRNSRRPESRGLATFARLRRQSLVKVATSQLTAAKNAKSKTGIWSTNFSAKPCRNSTN